MVLKDHNTEKPTNPNPNMSPKQKTPWLETPLIHSPKLSQQSNCQIYLKLENLQPSGSFKSRAMGNQILSHLTKLRTEDERAERRRQRNVHFFASSGGNAGLAAVCAARSLGYACTVVVPLTTTDLMVDRLYGAGAAEVVRFGENIKDASAYMEDVVMKGHHHHHHRRGSQGEPTRKDDDEEEEEETVKIALHPFDRESIWEGNSTIIDELETQFPPLVGSDSKEDANPKLENDDVDDTYRPIPVDAIICSVGGGGLLNGLILGLERTKQKHQQRQQQQQRQKKTQTQTQKQKQKKQNQIHLLAAETKGTHSLSFSLAENSLSSLPRISSQATSLGVLRVSEQTFNYALHPPEGIRVHSLVLSDAEAARGVLRLADSERILVELACGVCVDVVGGSEMEVRGQKRKTEMGEDEGCGVGVGIGDVDGGDKRRRDSDTAASSSSPPSLVDTSVGSESESDLNGLSSSSVSSATSTSLSSSSTITTAETAPSDSYAAADAASDVPVSPSESMQFTSRLYECVPDLTPQSKVVIIVCGGSNITVDMAAEYRSMLKTEGLI